MRCSMTWMVLLACAGCAGSGDSDNDDGGGFYEAPEIPSGPLEGVIGGQPWSMQGGTSSFGWTSKSDVDMHSAAMTASNLVCPDDAFGEDRVEIEFPDETGEWLIGESDTFVQIYVGDQSIWTNQGRIRIDAISDTQIDGAMVLDADEDNSIGGSFTLTRCDQDE